MKQLFSDPEQQAVRVPGLGSSTESEHTYQADDSAASCLRAVFMVQLQVAGPINIMAKIWIENTGELGCQRDYNLYGNISEKRKQLRKFHTCLMILLAFIEYQSKDTLVRFHSE